MDVSVIRCCVYFFQRSVGTFGLTGLDRLLCFMIVKELQNYQVLMNRTVLNPKEKTWIEALNSFTKTLSPVKGTVGKSTIRLKRIEQLQLKKVFLYHVNLDFMLKRAFAQTWFLPLSSTIKLFQSYEYSS